MVCHSSPQPDGTTDILVNFDLSQAPVPARRYAAETAWVSETTEPNAYLMFGQRRIIGGGLRSLISLPISPDALHRFLDTSRSFAKSLAEMVDRAHLPTCELEEVTAEPEQSVSLASNLITASFAGREACMDCYSISPWELRELGKGTSLGIEPVVRIDLPSTLLHSVLTKLYLMEEALPERIR